LNVKRRNLTKGQVAIAAAEAWEIMAGQGSGVTAVSPVTLALGGRPASAHSRRLHGAGVRNARAAIVNVRERSMILVEVALGRRACRRSSSGRAPPQRRASL